MYLSYFGLAEAPFSIAPTPRYLYMSQRHQEALAHLLYGVNSGGGFVLLTGEVGAVPGARFSLAPPAALAAIEARPLGARVVQLIPPENDAVVVENVTLAVPPRLRPTLSAPAQ